MDIPTFEINENELENLIYFISKHENLLKEYGAIKIQPNKNCKLALFKREKKFDFSPINEQIIKMNNNQFIYTVEQFDEKNKLKIKKTNFIKDESNFWSLLSSSKIDKQQLNISIIENKSYFSQKTSRAYFDIHRLPSQTILKYANKKYLNQFLPYIKRAHGPASIYPLNIIEQNLFSINYHHEGGQQYYYFIPFNQKNNLENILKKYNSSFCLDHSKLFLNPLLLDKYQIKYYKTIQKQNQFIILSSGTLSQSFTFHSNCTESIDFPLPSWFTDGYARNCFPICDCNINLNYSKETLDFNLFTNDIILNYINSINDQNLLSNKDINYMDIEIDLDTDFDDILTPNYHQINLNKRRISSIEDKSMISSFQLSPTSLIIPSINESFSDEDNLIKNNKSLNEDLYDINSNIYNENDEFISYEELMDFLPSNQNNDQNDSSRIINENENENKCLRNNNRALFISGLKNDITTNDLRNHFIGSIKITMKNYRSTSNLKYAFIVHRTAEDAERNLKEFVDPFIFGDQCRIEYAIDSTHIINNQQIYNENKIVVTKIPFNINENNLSHLFINGRILRYSPARYIYPTKNKNDNKLILGYAFIEYDNQEQADYVIKNCNQYQLNGQPVTINLYKNRTLTK